MCSPDRGLEGNWDSFNIMKVRFDGTNVVYSLNTTIMVEMKLASAELGELEISGYRREHK